MKTLIQKKYKKRSKQLICSIIVQFLQEGYLIQEMIAFDFLEQIIKLINNLTIGRSLSEIFEIILSFLNQETVEIPFDSYSKLCDAILKYFYNSQSFDEFFLQFFFKILSNIIIKSTTNLQKLMTESFFKKIFELNPLDETIFCLEKMISYSSSSNLRYLISQGILKYLSNILEKEGNTPEIILSIFQIIENIINSNQLCLYKIKTIFRSFIIQYSFHINFQVAMVASLLKRDLQLSNN